LALQFLSEVNRYKESDPPHILQGNEIYRNYFTENGLYRLFAEKLSEELKQIVNDISFKISQNNVTINLFDSISKYLLAYFNIIELFAKLNLYIDINANESNTPLPLSPRQSNSSRNNVTINNNSTVTTSTTIRLSSSNNTTETSESQQNEAKVRSQRSGTEPVPFLLRSSSRKKRQQQSNVDSSQTTTTISSHSTSTTTTTTNTSTSTTTAPNNVTSQIQKEIMKGYQYFLRPSRELAEIVGGGITRVTSINNNNINNSTIPSQLLKEINMNFTRMLKITLIGTLQNIKSVYSFFNNEEYFILSDTLIKV
jgi:hypothetical protein